MPDEERDSRRRAEDEKREPTVPELLEQIKRSRNGASVAESAQVLIEQSKKRRQR